MICTIMIDRSASLHVSPSVLKIQNRWALPCNIIVNKSIETKIMIAFFDEMVYNNYIMKYYAISLTPIKKGMLWVKVNF